MASAIHIARCIYHFNHLVSIEYMNTYIHLYIEYATTTACTSYLAFATPLAQHDGSYPLYVQVDLGSSKSAKHAFTQNGHSKKNFHIIFSSMKNVTRRFGD